MDKTVKQKLEEIRSRVNEKQKKNQYSSKTKIKECTQYCVFMSYKVHEWYHSDN